MKEIRSLYLCVFPALNPSFDIIIVLGSRKSDESLKEKLALGLVLSRASPAHSTMQRQQFDS